MEPTLDPAGDPDGAGRADLGELVLQNGPKKGAARPLIAPVLLVGRSAGCDLKLGGADIQLMHCALTADEAGWRVRNFAGADAVKVNGVPVTQGPVGDDDLIEIGRYQFRLRVNGPTPAQAAVELVDRLKQEKQALRTQAAAVSAQQAALIDQETQLVQRRTALDQQQEQLSAHLEEKRQRLIEMRDNARQAVETLRQERKQHADQVQADESERLAAWQEIVAERDAVRAAHKHLKQFRLRLKKRWHRSWVRERARMAQREAELAQQVREVDADRKHYQREHAELTAERVRFNTTVEIGRRQFVDAWAMFKQESTREEERLRKANADLRDRQKTLEQREAALVEADRDLQDRQQHWQQWRAQLEREIEGLENRARNCRRNLFDLEQASAARRAALEAPAAAPVLPAEEAPTSVGGLPALTAASEPPAALTERLRLVERLTEDLADQRAQLIEQAQRLVQAKAAWRQDCEAVAADLEQTGKELHDREMALLDRQSHCTALEVRLQQRQAAVAHAQRQLEGGQARIANREAAWQGERDRLLAAVAAREKLAEQRLAAVSQLARRWSSRQQREREHLITERSALDHLRRELTDLKGEWHRRVTEVQRAQRRLAEQALALEQYRRQYLAASDQPAQAARRLDRLKARWAAQSAAGRKVLADRRDALQREYARLEEYARHVERLTAARLKAEEEFAAEQRAWDQGQLLRQDEVLRLRADLATQKAHRERFEKQLLELHDEVERIACFLLDEGDAPPHLPIAHAA